MVEFRESKLQLLAIFGPRLGGDSIGTTSVFAPTAIAPIDSSDTVSNVVDACEGNGVGDLDLGRAL